MCDLSFFLLIAGKMLRDGPNDAKEKKKKKKKKEEEEKEDDKEEKVSVCLLIIFSVCLRLS